MLTIKDIAKAAGVSITTASRALRGRPDVAEATAERIRRIARELGYRPNVLARSLRTQTVQTIGLAITDNGNPFYARLMRGTQDAANMRGYRIVFANTDEDPQLEVKAIEGFLENRVAGLLLVPSMNQSADTLRPLVRDHPAVLVSRHLKGLETHLVMTDDVKGGYLATRHLLETGHERIAFVNGPLGISNAVDRFEGFKKAFEERGLRWNEEYIRFGCLRIQDGYRAAKELLEGPRPDGIFCFSDFVAMGVIKALWDEGLAVPEDVSVVGYDDIEFVKCLPTALTTIVHPMYRMGMKACNLVIDLIEGTHFEGPRRIILEPDLVIRQSSSIRGKDSGCTSSQPSACP